MEDRSLNMKYEYSYEIDEINYILHNLEMGRIYEKTNAKGDGYLATNICNLRKLLNELMTNIQKNELGIGTPETEIFRRY